MIEWDQTYTGRRIDPLNPKPADIDIEDIAHALAMMCRYGGNVSRFYSVAEHSILVSQHVAPQYAREALLHDACEAGAVDMPRWLKRLPAIRAIVVGLELRRTNAIYERFGIESTRESRAAVKSIDKRIVVDEINELKTYPEMYTDRYRGVQPVGADIIGYSPEHAKVMFLLRFYELWPVVN